MDEEGFLYLKGRNKNIIISGGINIYPEEVEEVINEIDGVKKVCVRGVADEDMGEIAIAEVVKSCGELSKEDIINYCYNKLSLYKIPKDIVFVDDLKLTYNGKIRRSL